MDYINIIAIVITAVMAIFAGKWETKLKGFLKETGEFKKSIEDALEDGKVTKEEIGNIVKEFTDIIEVFK